MLLPLAFLAGCAGQPIDVAQTALIEASTKVVEPKLAARCLAIADKCVADGVPTPADCKALQVCRCHKRAWALAYTYLHRTLAAIRAGDGLGACHALTPAASRPGR
jgi:hypothetical protein